MGLRVIVDKRYFDTLFDDGSALFVYLVRLRVMAARLGWVGAEVVAADGGRHRGGQWCLCAAGGQLAGGRFDGARLEWSTRGLRGRLEWRARYPPAILCDPVFDDGVQTVRWSVEVPDADVQGHLEWPGGGRREVRGRGYADRVHVRVVPWRFPVRRVRWGRAATESHAQVWFDAETTCGRARAAWRDGRVEGGGDAPPLLRSRVVLDERLGERLAGRVRFLRAALRRLVSDPHQLRWLAGVRLAGQDGRAVHEEARWA